MDQIVPGANIVAGVLVLIVGFGFHFTGQLISIVDWDRAVAWGLQEKDARPEYQIYERGIAAADVALGWTYGIAGLGLVLDAPWGYAWAWLPGAILTYHALSFWFWTANQRANGDRYPINQNPARTLWAVANLATGLLAMAVATSQMIVPTGG